VCELEKGKQPVTYNAVYYYCICTCCSSRVFNAVIPKLLHKGTCLFVCVEGGCEEGQTFNKNNPRYNQFYYIVLPILLCEYQKNHCPYPTNAVIQYLGVYISVHDI
jgi:hypothetical protein